MGHSAFAHKGGVHVSAVLKDSSTYEHIKPEAVGNRQRVLLSDLSGTRQHPLQAQAAWLGGPPGRRRRAANCSIASSRWNIQGYELEAAEGTFELLVREALRPGLQFFEVVSYEVTTSMVGDAPPRL